MMIVEKRIEPEKARQGRRGWQVLMILIASLIFVMIAWYAIEAYHSVAEEPAAAASISVPVENNAHATIMDFG